MRHRQLTMGADTSELYLCTYWYPYSVDSMYEIIMHSTDNGLSFSLGNNRNFGWFGIPSSLYGDAAPGVVYESPDHSADTFSVSFDSGMTLTHKYFPDNPVQCATGCVPGEILIQGYLTNPFIGPVIFRSHDYGSTFDTIHIPDSLALVDIGVNPGELYFRGYRTDYQNIKIVFSPDYGATFEKHVITVPYCLDFDLRRGASQGEFYLLVYEAGPEDHFFIYHVTNYGENFTLQSVFNVNCECLISYSAGRKPGTFYVARRSTWTPDLYIDYSTDYGVTFTTYTHYLDSTYTETANLDKAIGIRVYPNPTSTELNIDLPKDNGYNHLQLLNLFGQVSLQQDIKQGSEKVLVDVTKLSRGFYMVKVTTKDNGVLTRKVVVN
ncbi:MAG: T9SS type A sorting domain-containing protein [Bacteroidota bacterium]